MSSPRPPPLLLQLQPHEFIVDLVDPSDSDPAVVYLRRPSRMKVHVWRKGKGADHDAEKQSKSERHKLKRATSGANVFTSVMDASGKQLSTLRRAWVVDATEAQQFYQNVSLELGLAEDHWTSATTVRVFGHIAVSDQQIAAASRQLMTVEGPVTWPLVVVSKASGKQIGILKMDATLLSARVQEPDPHSHVLQAEPSGTSAFYPNLEVDLDEQEEADYAAAASEPGDALSPSVSLSSPQSLSSPPSQRPPRSVKRFRLAVGQIHDRMNMLAPTIDRIGRIYLSEADMVDALKASKCTPTQMSVPIIGLMANGLNDAPGEVIGSADIGLWYNPGTDEKGEGRSNEVSRSLSTQMVRWAESVKADEDTMCTRVKILELRFYAPAAHASKQAQQHTAWMQTKRLARIHVWREDVHNGFKPKRRMRLGKLVSQDGFRLEHDKLATDRDVNDFLRAWTFHLPEPREEGNSEQEQAQETCADTDKDIRQVVPIREEAAVEPSSAPGQTGSVEGEPKLSPSAPPAAEMAAAAATPSPSASSPAPVAASAPVAAPALVAMPSGSSASATAAAAAPTTKAAAPTTKAAAPTKPLSFLERTRLEAATSQDPTRFSRIQQQMEKEEQYRLSPAEIRNVIMVGRTRSGKSTVVQVLRDVTHRPPQMRIFSETQNTEFNSFVIEDNTADGVKRYNVNIIDTPGLFEVSEMNKEARSNDAILKLIKQCLEHQIVKIHLVLIFASFVNGFNENDLNAIRMMVDAFRGSDIRVGLCLTRCETYNEVDEQRLTGELKRCRVDTIKELVAKPENVFFMGCVSRPEDHNSDVSLQHAYRNVQRYRVRMLESIFHAELRDDQGMLRSTRLLSGTREQMKESIVRLPAMLAGLKRVSDWQLTDSLAMRGRFERTLQQVREAAAFFDDENDKAQLLEVEKTMQDIVRTRPKTDELAKLIVMACPHLAPRGQ